MCLCSFANSKIHLPPLSIDTTEGEGALGAVKQQPLQTHFTHRHWNPLLLLGSILRERITSFASSSASTLQLLKKMMMLRCLDKSQWHVAVCRSLSLSLSLSLSFTFAVGQCIISLLCRVEALVFICRCRCRCRSRKQRQWAPKSKRISWLVSACSQTLFSGSQDFLNGSFNLIDWLSLICCLDSGDENCF